MYLLLKRLTHKGSVHTDAKNRIVKATPDSGLLERTVRERPVPATGIPFFRGII
jgi:hypothetical protein